jgi:hypothetical protein
VATNFYKKEEVVEEAEEGLARRTEGAGAATDVVWLRQDL